MCRSYRREIVISEDPLAWIERNDMHTTIGREWVQMMQYREIDEKIYEEFKYKNPSAPSKEHPVSCSAFPMKKGDYFGNKTSI